MDLRRLRAGEWIVGAAGVLLLVSLFLPWYGDGESLTGWEGLGVLDVVLVLLALGAISIPIVTAAYRVPAMPLALQSLVTLFGMGVLVAVIFRVLNVPDETSGREWGLWVGLLATLGVVAGALLAMRDERRSPAGRHTDLSGVPVAGPPDIETMPAPRPEAGP
jgi:hypothetical protein